MGPPYSRELAVYPDGFALDRGARQGVAIWLSRRVSTAFGDRNLVCSCPPIEAFAE